MSLDLSHQYCHFFDDAAFADTDRPGFRRRVITGISSNSASGASPAGPPVR